MNLNILMILNFKIINIFKSISEENLNELNYYSEILKNYFYSIAENIGNITKNSIPENFKDTIINNVELSKEEISYFFKRNIAYKNSCSNFLREIQKNKYSSMTIYTNIKISSETEEVLQQLNNDGLLQKTIIEKAIFNNYYDKTIRNFGIALFLLGVSLKKSKATIKEIKNIDDIITEDIQKKILEIKQNSSFLKKLQAKSYNFVTKLPNTLLSERKNLSNIFGLSIAVIFGINGIYNLYMVSKHKNKYADLENKVNIKTQQLLDSSVSLQKTKQIQNEIKLVINEGSNGILNSFISQKFLENKQISHYLNIKNYIIPKISFNKNDTKLSQMYSNKIIINFNFNDLKDTVYMFGLEQFVEKILPFFGMTSAFSFALGISILTKKFPPKSYPKLTFFQIVEKVLNKKIGFHFKHIPQLKDLIKPNQLKNISIVEYNNKNEDFHNIRDLFLSSKEAFKKQYPRIETISKYSFKFIVCSILATLILYNTQEKLLQKELYIKLDTNENNDITFFYDENNNFKGCIVKNESIFNTLSSIEFLKTIDNTTLKIDLVHMGNNIYNLLEDLKDNSIKDPIDNAINTLLSNITNEKLLNKENKNEDDTK